MSNIASSSLRQASRLCAKHTSSAGLIRTGTVSRALPFSAQKISRRGYVSETKKDNAQVSAETAIMADQKAFFAETGKLPENLPMQGTTAYADAMMSPIAGILDSICWILGWC
jgi:cysteine desulfurase